LRINLPHPTDFASLANPNLPEGLTGIATDSRECREGDLYIALTGERMDGHEFVSNAFEQCASAALVARDRASGSSKEIIVDDPLTALGEMANEWRRQFDIPIIGITGSNGKTTTKDLLAHALSDSETVYATEGNFNTSIGLPLTLLSMPKDTTVAVLEMGANQPGDIKILCDISQPTHGLITNIAPAHLEGFGTIEAVAETKAAMFRALTEGTAFVNAADPRIVTLPIPNEKITFGITPDCDFPADIHHEEDGTITLTVDSEEVPTGSQNLSFAKNVIASAALAVTLGLNWDQFRKAIQTFMPPKGRCQVRLFNDITIIDDTYNANLESTEAAIDYLAAFSGGGRRMLVFGDMFELGDSSKEQHRKVGEKCINAQLDALFTVGQETIHTDAAASILPFHQHFDSKEALAEALKDSVKSGDHLLVKGSRGMEMETVIEELVAA